MKVSLSAFGAARTPLAAEKPLIYIVHGFLSDESKMKDLEDLLQPLLKNATIDRFDYNWRQSVLLSGCQLAKKVLDNPEKERPLILVGHSMGGLVSRVANVIVSDPARFAAQIPFLGYFGYQDDINFIKSYWFASAAKRKVSGIVTLAAPNSGAMLQGQLSSYMSLAQWAVNKWSSFRHQSVQDLTTDRLFRLLQAFTSQTPVLSISGSKMNRFSIGAGRILKVSGKFGLNLTLPHDLVVEDVSVDLTRSILPNELTHHGSAAYVHLRAYENCTDVTHSSIHNNLIVAGYIADFVSRC